MGYMNPALQYGFERFCAEAAAAGETRITPYWRTLKSGGELNAKYPGGVAELKKRLRAEGHRVVAKGKRFVVVDYEACLCTNRK